jgi:hypothetical protein
MRTLLIIAVLAFSAPVAAEPSTTRSFYDNRGSFAGQSFTRGNSTSFSDGQGRFSGSAIATATARPGWCGEGVSGLSSAFGSAPCP